MAAVGKALVNGSQIAGSNTTYYTAGTQTRLDKCTVTNTTGGAVSFDLHLVPDGGSADATNQVIVDHNVNDGETYTCPEVVGQWLNKGQFLVAGASSATSLTLRVSGIEVT